jgi:ParB family chromosome partitioning protein
VYLKIEMPNQDDKILTVPIDVVEFNPFQSRKFFDDIEALATSIKATGLQQPPVVRPHPKKNETYQLAFGERRLRACKRLGWEEVQVIIRDYDDVEMAELSLAENIQRRSLNPIEEAEGFKLLREKFNYNVTSIAEKIGLSRPYVANKLRLLEMPYFLQACVACDVFSASHALAILALPEGYAHYAMADLVIDWSFSVHETRRLIKDINEKKYLIQWEEKVPLAEIWEYVPKTGTSRTHTAEDYFKIRDSMRVEGQHRPISVLIDGAIFDGVLVVRAARELGWQNINAIVLFPTKLLKVDVPGYPILVTKGNIGRPPRGIQPKISEVQKRNISKLNKMLRRHLESEQGFKDSDLEP